MSSFPRLSLKKRHERRVLSGHLWVYSNEVDTAITPLTEFEAGEIVDITSHSGKWLGNGYVNSHSLISARVVSRNKDYPFSESLIVHRLKVALGLREMLYDAPYYRLVYADSDFLPGVVIDRYSDVVVVQITTAGMERMRKELVSAIQKVLRPSGILLRCDNPLRKLENLDLYTDTEGNVPDTVVVPENGCEFEVGLASGQKTGWFYDQRDNRNALLPLVDGKTVIDTCSYVGSWGIQAAKAGAKRVICIDSSAEAVNLVDINAQRNGVSEKVFTAQGDAFDTLRDLRQDQENADVVILDPPAFIKRKKDVKNGTEAYLRLMRRGLQLTVPGGILVSCSCSYHMQRDTFVEQLNNAGRHIDRSLQIFHEGRQSRDHPVHPAMPETQYLKALFARSLARA
jgi:23S rRNA (cytosine1962-C5)-methyltransferase